MGRWSEWHPLTEDSIEEFGIEETGVYQIALGDRWIIEYPFGESPIIYIGVAPVRILKDRLKDHIQGEGNQCVYEYSQRYALFWRDMIISGNPEYTEENILKRFAAEFGDIPACNKRME